MEYVEYVLVGSLVAIALGYAVWRIRRAFQGKDGCGCAFSGSDSPPPCAKCPAAKDEDPEPREKRADG